MFNGRNTSIAKVTLQDKMIFYFAMLAFLLIYLLNLAKMKTQTDFQEKIESYLRDLFPHSNNENYARTNLPVSNNIRT